MIYVMVLTRLDISYTLSIVSRYMTSLGKEHWKAVKWVLIYLNITMDYGLMFGRFKEANSIGL